MPKPKRPYMKPLAVKEKMERIGSAFSGIRTYFIAPKFAPYPKMHYVRVYKTEKKRKIMERLRNAGLNVESPGNVSKPKVTVSRYMGKTLDKYLKTQPKENSKKALMSAFELVGKVHALGVLHGHPHSGNLVVGKNGRVGLVDFKRAKTVSPNWINPQDVFAKFRYDYAHFNLILEDVISGVYRPVALRQRSFFTHLLAQYPCTNAVRKEIMRLIEKDLKLK